MMTYDLVIRGGTVVTADAVSRCDLAILDGRVAALGLGLPPGREEIDATDRLLLPGGVDTHAHVEQPSDPPLVNADSFESASASALVGGTTSLVCFARQPRGGSLRRAVDDYAPRVARSRIDVALHLMITDPRPEVMEEELPALVAEGHRSVKIFLTYDGPRVSDGQALRVLAAARRLGALVCVHAEHHELIEFHKQALIEAGLTAPKYHAWAKPILVERECIHRVASMAEALDVPVQIFHVSGAESAEEVERFQRRGLKLWAETCPQYLVLTAEDLDRPGMEGAKFLCSPAPRSRADQEALWAAIRRGVIANISSDHAPNRFEGPDGKLAHGHDAPFTRIANGVPGLAARLPILFSEGVSKGRIGLRDFAALSAANPARLFGLARKGSLAVGADADIAIWNPDRRVTLTNALMQHGCDYTPYEGMEVRGWPETTLLRGRLACADGTVLAPPGAGALLRRDAYPFIAPRGVFPGPFDPVAARPHQGADA